ncbi:MAG: FAD/NAD(P)-binding protein [Planctomycetaceae bacterium]
MSTDLWVPQTAIIQDVTPEIEGVMTFHLALAESDDYSFLPGQFNMLYVPGAGEAAISMSGDPTSTELLAHTIRVVGNVTRSIGALQVGDSLGIRGPFGTGWPMEESAGRDVILVAGGIGLPPLRPVLYRLLAERERYGQIFLLYGARSPELRLYTSEYSSWTARGVVIKETVDRKTLGWHGNVGVVPLLLEQLEKFNPERSILMICGPEVMMRFTARSAIQRGMTAEQIWVSTERNMQCAWGCVDIASWDPNLSAKMALYFAMIRSPPI